jgi:hypothetical protein
MDYEKKPQVNTHTIPYSVLVDSHLVLDKNRITMRPTMATILNL